jgi:hypothetical protein
LRRCARKQICGGRYRLPVFCICRQINWLSIRDDRFVNETKSNCAPDLLAADLNLSFFSATPIRHLLAAFRETNAPTAPSSFLHKSRHSKATTRLLSTLALKNRVVRLCLSLFGLNSSLIILVPKKPLARKQFNKEFNVHGVDTRQPFSTQKL